MNLSATGFIQGCDIGKYKIVKSLFPIGFNKNNIDTLYHNIYEKIGDQLMGVFFYSRELFFSDWFAQDIILKIGKKQTDIYHYGYDKNMTENRLLQTFKI